MVDYHAIGIEEALSQLKTSNEGLDDDEVQRRLERYGPNALQQRKRISPAKILLRQFTSFIVVILIAAMAISLLIGERLDAAVIAIIVVLNGIFGFVQEYKAERAIEALRKLTALKATVIREGIRRKVDSTDLVPGDIIVLETGSKVPADARLIDVAALQADESSLTGESVPSKKSTQAIKADVLVSDRENMVFMGTIITQGHAIAIVTATGMHTQIGKIAEAVQEVGEKKTPLQEKLAQFGRWLGIVTIIICAIVFGVGVLREFLATQALDAAHVSEMFLAAVALAVAAIPEGLPAIVTISLALGVRRMVKRNALIRKLPAVETLGSTNVICSDKTGTLTKNEMTVRELYLGSEVIKLSGEGYEPKGSFTQAGKPFDPKRISLLLRIGALCNDATLSHTTRWEITGDPTEASLIVAASKAGFDKQALEKRYPRIDEIPFDSKRKCMTTIHQDGKGRVAYVKGAPDIMLEKCSHILINDKRKPLTAADKRRILDVNHQMADRALRVLGFAYKDLKPGADASKTNEDDLTFVGLQAMIDPPREEVREAIAKCRTAGIRTVLITGDHKLTAMAIASELGLFNKGDKAISGAELDEMSEHELEKEVSNVSIFARVSPEHKVKILNALRKRGHVVAMTGDGVNDAPALKRSDIGVAMGITGTDVAKEASDMVLTDDNFASIVNAVEEGRGIYASIKQFVQYTLSSNLGEILVIFLAILIGWPLPLIAIQILWVNLLTDGLPGLALGLDPFSKGLMRRPPRKRNEGIISREVITNILIVGVVMGVGTLALFYLYGGHLDGAEEAKARSVAFTTLILFQLFNVLTYRAERFAIDLRRSKFLLGAVAVSVVLQFALLYTPLSVAFKTVPLDLLDWLIMLGVSSTLYIVLELRKMWRAARGVATI